MRVGLDGIPLAAVKTGIGHYTLELARALAQLSAADEFQLISPVASPGLSAAEVQGFPPNLQLVRTKYLMLWWTAGLPLYIRQTALPLFHGTNYELPLWNGCARVVSIHDLSLLLHPETHRPAAVSRARRRLPLIAKAADMIITCSESVKQEICGHLRVNADKVVVTPYAARDQFKPVAKEDAAQVRQRLGIDEQFILFVGTIEPRKNLIVLIKAFAELLRTTTLRPQLVLAGNQGWLNEELFSCIRESGVGDRICFPGYVDDDDLAALYSACSVSVYPSIYEGFGLPPLEAMACGAPVITTNIPAITETVGSAAVLVSPTDVQALTKSITEVLTDPNQRQRLAEAGVRQAAQFSWEKTAKATLEVYLEAMKRRALKARRAGSQ